MDHSLSGEALSAFALLLILFVPIAVVSWDELKLWWHRNSRLP